MSDFGILMLEFARAGFDVFPYLERFKKGNNSKGVPTNANGTNKDKSMEFAATSSVPKVMEWLQLPDIIGYGVTNHNCLILDIDCGHGKKNAEAAMESWSFLKGDLQLQKPSLSVQSKSGGYHLYYKKPDFDITSVTASSIIPGIDLPWHVSGPEIKGNWKKGTYAVSTGNIDATLAPVGNKCEEWLKANFKRVDYLAANLALTSEPEVHVFDGSIPDIISGGERHLFMVRLIGHLASQNKLPRSSKITLIQDALAKCERDDKDPMKSLEEYIVELDNTMAKPSFNKPIPDPLKFFLDNAIYVKQQDGVFEIPNRTLYVKGLANVYAQHYWYQEKPGHTEEKPKLQKINAYKAWLEHEDRVTVEDIGYKPVKDHVVKSKVLGKDVANTYRPPILPEPNDDTTAIGKFKDLVEYLGGDKSDKLMDWVICQVKEPHKKLQIAIALISDTRGIGKNMFLYIIARCIGQHNFEELPGTNALFEKHAEFGLKSHLVVINEASTDLIDRYTQRDSKKIFEWTKDLITKQQILIDVKYLRPVTVDFFTDFVFTTNNLHALPMEEKDRRFEIFICPDDKLSEEEYDYYWSLSDQDIANIRSYIISQTTKVIDHKYSAVEIDYAKESVITAGRSRVEEELTSAIENKVYVFKEDIITFELFSWFILNHIGTITQGFASDLFKRYCKPIYRKVGNRARDPKVKVPALNFKGGDYIPEYDKKRYIYCCRNHHYYNSEEGRNLPVIFFKERYDINYSATQPGYEEPDTSQAETMINELRQET